MGFHLLVCLSSHGYGHFTMTAPILNALRGSVEFDLTIRTTLPKKLLKTRIDGDFSVAAETADFGMVMHDSFDVDLEKSADAYRLFHANYEQKVQEESRALHELKPDLVLANIPYLTIDAAHLLGVPCVAYCSLNWLEIFSHYFNQGLSEEKKIRHQIEAAYNKATVFLCPAPSMPMPRLMNVVTIGPVAKQSAHSINLNAVIGCKLQTKIVLVTPGGVSTHIPIENWPKEKNIIWVCSWPLTTSRNDIVSTHDLAVSFNDVLANCDAVISKPGYGTVTETVCNQVPVLYMKRGDWPEEVHLLHWWHEHGVVSEISREALQTGELIPSLKKLWQEKNKKRMNPTGIEGACDIISQCMKNISKKKEKT